MKKALILYYSECQRWQLFKGAVGCLAKGSPTQCPSLSQPSQEVVKEMIQFSKDTLEKIDKARSEGLYHKVRIHFYRGWGWGGGQKDSLVKEGNGGGGGVKMGRLQNRLFFWKMSLG